MIKINTSSGPVYVVDASYWAGEHSFTHYANATENVRGNHTDLWAIDLYDRKGLNPLMHYKRLYIWADSNNESAAKVASRYINDHTKVLITHIVPLNDRLREPATF